MSSHHIAIRVIKRDRQEIKIDDTTGAFRRAETFDKGTKQIGQICVRCDGTRDLQQRAVFPRLTCSQQVLRQPYQAHLVVRLAFGFLRFKLCQRTEYFLAHLRLPLTTADYGSVFELWWGLL